MVGSNGVHAYILERWREPDAASLRSTLPE